MASTLIILPTIPATSGKLKAPPISLPSITIP